MPTVCDSAPCAWLLIDRVSRSRVFSSLSALLTSITAFHDGVGSMGPSSEMRKSPPRFAIKSLRTLIWSFASASLQSAFVPLSWVAIAMMSSAMALGSFESPATATAAFGVTKSSDPMGAGLASHDATRCLVPENCRFR